MPKKIYLIAFFNESFLFCLPSALSDPAVVVVSSSTESKLDTDRVFFRGFFSFAGEISFRLPTTKEYYCGSKSVNKVLTKFNCFTWKNDNLGNKIKTYIIHIILPAFAALEEV